MKTIHVTMNVRGLPAAELAVYGQSIAAALEQNAAFARLNPGAAELQQAIDALNAAIAGARPGYRAAIAAMHAACAGLNRVLKAVAAQVEYASHNNETLALSSGFSVQKPAPHAGRSFAAKQGLHSGTVCLKCPALKHSGYVWQVATDPVEDEDSWITVAVSTQANYTVNNLKPVTKYWFRVALVTSQGQQPFCDPVMLLVI